MAVEMAASQYVRSADIYVLTRQYDVKYLQTVILKLP
jgi:hypothetical protein